MTKPEEITMTNTKKEMLTAYNNLLKQMEEKRINQATSEQKIEQKAKEQIVEVADKAVEENLSNNVLNLKSEIGRMLNGLNEKLDAEVERYQKVKQAVTLKENELQDIYEIQKVASTLDALLETQRQKQEVFQAEMAKKKELLEGEIQATRKKWIIEQTAYEQDMKDRVAKEKRQYDRDSEDLKYKMERDKQQAVEQFEYEKKRMERELTMKREDMEKGLSEREQAVAAVEQELIELRKNDKAFAAQLDAAVNKAVKQATEALQTTAAAERQLLQKEYEGRINVLAAQIEAARKTIEEQSAQLERQNKQLDRSYSQVQDIATTAIEGSSAKAAQAVSAAIASRPIESADNKTGSLEK